MEEEFAVNSVKEKRKLKGARRVFKDTGARRVLIAGICPEVPESSHNFRIILNKCQVGLQPNKVTGGPEGFECFVGCRTLFKCLPMCVLYCSQAIQVVTYCFSRPK